MAVSLAVVALLNWLVIVLAALREGAREKTCFVRCYPPAHIGWATPFLFSPLCLIVLSIVAALTTRRASRHWRVLQGLALACAVAVGVGLALHPDALEFVPPWRWLRVSSVG